MGRSMSLNRLGERGCRCIDKIFANVGPNREVPGVPKTLTKLYHVPAFLARLKDTHATGEQLLSDLGTWVCFIYKSSKNRP